MRVIAQQVAERAPVFFAVHAIDEGDALALATRTAFEYAYRARQAVFWNPTFSARKVLDRPRGLLRIDGTFAGARIAVFATQFSDDRAARVRELRFLRTRLRAAKRAALLFVAGVVEGEAGFADLGFATLAYAALDADRGALVAARDFSVSASIARV